MSTEAAPGSLDTPATTHPTTSTDTTTSDSAEVAPINSAADPADDEMRYPNGMHPMLRYCTPYWWPYRTFVKKRWIGRQLLEVIATEFRDRSVEYYWHALESGVTRINGVEAYPEYILRDGDRLE